MEVYIVRSKNTGIHGVFTTFGLALNYVNEVALKTDLVRINQVEGQITPREYFDRLSNDFYKLESFQVQK